MAPNPIRKRLREVNEEIASIRETAARAREEAKAAKFRLDELRAEQQSLKEQVAALPTE
ncbi:hypothetical protein [Propylenella binzhouense]|uniref:hypothetical protein n=1 Tax=Propylenella binzhouense TaxID=2555902 RepID=UPI001370C41E|nr:hypothetical protein [Propylenella binzhouense]